MATTEGGSERWHRPCPVCAGDRPQRLLAMPFAALDGMDLGYTVARCAECGFHYASELAAPAVYAAYYRSLSKYDSLPAAASAGTPGASANASASLATLPAALRERAAFALQFCRPHLPPAATVADIGCGAGALLATFRAAGHAVCGLDPAPAAARALLATGAATGARIEAGGLRDAERLPLADCDLVCLTGTAEHLPCLREDLAWLCAALPERAKLLIEVPALESFPVAGTPCEPCGEFSLEHLQYFDAASLLRLLAALGYRALACARMPAAGGSESLFALFARGVAPNLPPNLSPNLSANPSVTDDGQAARAAARERCDAYLAHSAAGLVDVIARIAAHDGRFMIYGAGSHSARLLPQLAAAGLDGRVAGIVDGNPNLQGKRLGAFTIAAPETLATMPGCTVLVSSFHAQPAIVAGLAGRHPLLLLYDRR